MEPLDLTITPPRGPRATICGAMVLPRTIDKIRAELPGGDPGPYIVDTVAGALSPFACARFGIDLDALRAVVRDAADENEVAAWLRERLDPVVVDRTNATLEKLVHDRLPEPVRSAFYERHPGALESESTRILDILEADDAHQAGYIAPARFER